ncbi:ABC transporter permease [Halomonas denitrificans]|uniref:ABC transporter permease n=1 Tax=Halomonas denitrificans TaxID=370769 RepID=UPI001CD6AD7E|nr:ABC transporter permease [Halomonas denitrificans]MCA0974347.1 ABC transporter permease [Halomonas denitrificans]
MSRVATRHPWVVTRSVWYALFLREAIARTMTDRMGWFWMVAEPIIFTLIMVAIRSFIHADSLVIGAPFLPWMVVGLMGFFLVREGMTRGMGAIGANQALFAYRQVVPIDPVIVRVGLEGLLRSFIFLLFIAGGLLLKVDAIAPDDALIALSWWLSLWVLGLALGLIVSVLATLVVEVAIVLRMVMMPLLILSGVIFPIQVAPHWAQQYLLLNPVVHGLEHLREGFFVSYWAVVGVSAVYFWLVTLALMAIGLILHLRYKHRLIAH